jgi:anthranilate phosphoribosyltransferase
MDHTPSPADLLAEIARISSGEILSADEAESAFHRIMGGGVSPVQMAAFLVALRTRGVAPVEVAGGVRALRRAMIPVVASDPDSLVDTCGTGGGQISTFNVSTAAALVAAGGGVRVAKHGNRSFTSRSGSADVLEALGVRIDLSPEEMSRVLGEVGIVFMFAPLLHPAMRHVGPVRRELRLPTIMNLLGPLTNPAGARRQVVGVSDPSLLPLVAGALKELGHLRAMVVHGEAGMDEISPLGTTRIAWVDEGGLVEQRVEPEELGVERVSPADVALAGGSPEENASVIQQILEGRLKGAGRTLVILNAAAAFHVSGMAADLREGAALAADSLDSGSALRSLEALRASSHAGDGNHPDS